MQIQIANTYLCERISGMQVNHKNIFINIMVLILAILPCCSAVTDHKYKLF